MEHGKEYGFLAAMKTFFGLKPNQTMGDFAAEMKSLDDNDRTWFHQEFLKQGYKVAAPSPATAA